MELPTFSAASILHLNEVAAGAADVGSSCRFIGVIDDQDAEKRMITLRDHRYAASERRGARVVIDASLNVAPVAEGMLVTVLCDVATDVHGKRTLVLRLLRDSTGLDTQLYDEALAAGVHRA